MGIRKIKRELSPYSVGALLYTPLLNTSLADDLCSKKFGDLRSIALCMEDSIQDEALAEAEETLMQILRRLQERIRAGSICREDLPLIFIRIRSVTHMERIFAQMGDLQTLTAGFILPKFDLTNAETYRHAIERMNEESSEIVYVMPILESAALIQSPTRRLDLGALKQTIDLMRQYTLNIRVGGNDFCSLYGLRRNCRQTIYDIEVVKAALTDIYTVFGTEYVVSGPVWEYFKGGDSDAWKIGLERELELDKLNGFVGKTAIHPSQVPVIERALAVSETDCRDAEKIIGWEHALLGVAKSSGGDRMNEVKVHTKWARKILNLAELYGIAEEEKNS